MDVLGQQTQNTENPADRAHVGIQIYIEWLSSQVSGPSSFYFLPQTSCGMLGKSLNGFYAFVLFCSTLHWIFACGDQALSVRNPS